MPDFGYQAPDIVNQFNQGQQIGMQANAMQQQSEMNKQRMGLMSQEMKMRLDENTRKIGKENALAMINDQVGVAMAAKLAEQQGQDPATAYKTARENLVKKNPLLAPQVPDSYSPANVNALLALSTEAADHVMNIDMKGKEMKMRGEEHNAMMADRAESRDMAREQHQWNREDRKTSQENTLKLQEIKMEQAKLRGASGGMTALPFRAASQIVKAYEAKQAAYGDITPEETALYEDAQQTLAETMRGGRPSTASPPASIAAPDTGFPAPPAAPQAAPSVYGNYVPGKGFVKSGQ